MRKLPWFLIALAGLGVLVVFSVSCPEKSGRSEIPTIEEARGLTADEIAERWQTPLVRMDGSFELLVSKNLHPYQPPPEHELLRFGETYVVLEFAEGKLIAIHRVSG